MSYQDISVSCADRVCTITLNRPTRLNAWTQRMEEELRSAVLSANDDASVGALVLTGEGRGFCAGADIEALKGVASPLPVEVSDPRDTVAGIERNYSGRFGYLLRVGKPIFAAINGPVAGIGLCVALFCDFRYMAEGQKLSTAFSKRGLIAEHGSSWMLPRLVGLTNALDLLMSARAIFTKEAAEMGLVKALPVEGFLAAVQAIASELVRTASPRSMGIMKRQVYDSLFQDLDSAWRIADEEMAASFASEDFAEGIAHFVEKRAPSFSGR